MSGVIEERRIGDLEREERKIKEVRYGEERVLCLHRHLHVGDIHLYICVYIRVRVCGGVFTER